MSDRRREAEDTVEDAATRWLAADDAYILLKRLLGRREANEFELEETERSLRTAEHALERAHAHLAEVAGTELRSALARSIGPDLAQYAVAVKVWCGWSPSRGDAVCTRVCGRVLVVSGDRWVWVGADDAGCIDLDESSDMRGTCSKHGDRVVDLGELTSAIGVARQRPKRWPLTVAGH